ncbi:hypothetical protein [Nitrosopumilus sp.]|uniref:hypothetical protein n=1 Tax=Nitrosopumilus sp. TaxID=2024843 RepID=UPI002607E3A9|nr:hypothetical protein [Nitrosopumilus sp.]
MDDDEKGKRFLELIDEQSNLQWSIVSKVSALIKSEWQSSNLQNELKELVQKHESITKELNSLDENNSML